MFVWKILWKNLNLIDKLSNRRVEETDFLFPEIDLYAPIWRKKEQKEYDMADNEIQAIATILTHGKSRKIQDLNKLREEIFINKVLRYPRRLTLYIFNELCINPVGFMVRVYAIDELKINPNICISYSYYNNGYSRKKLIQYYGIKQNGRIKALVDCDSKIENSAQWIRDTYRQGTYKVKNTQDYTVIAFIQNIEVSWENYYRREIFLYYPPKLFRGDIQKFKPFYINMVKGKAETL